MDKFIQDVAKEAGAAVLKRFGKDRVHYRKSVHRGDVVTKADLASEHIIIDAIRKKYPSHGIIAEESGGMNESAEYVWIIDPLDGTLNFASDVPMFAVMIALAHKKQVILSCIYFPSTRELFFAKKGRGAYLNGKRIHGSGARELDGSVGSCSSRIQGRNAAFLRNVLAAGRSKNIVLLSAGSISGNACYVACGRRDWIVPLLGALHDFAPISLMLKEAGCKVTDTKGRPWQLGQLEMVAANPTLHKQLLRLTKNI